MLIWLGKQLLGQRDAAKVEQTGPDGRPVQHQVAVTLSDVERERVKAFLDDNAAHDRPGLGT